MMVRGEQREKWKIPRKSQGINIKKIYKYELFATIRTKMGSKRQLEGNRKKQEWDGKA